MSNSITQTHNRTHRKNKWALLLLVLLAMASLLFSQRFAVVNAAAALASSLWMDQTHLQMRPSSLLVFQQLKQAVNKLLWLINYDRNPIPDPVLQGFLDRLLRGTRELSVVALNDATQAGGNPTIIAAGNQELRDGDRDVNRGQFEHAIDEYAECWILAQLSFAVRR